jgi:polar amino acid transport system substrate-binding protein
MKTKHINKEKDMSLSKIKTLAFGLSTLLAIGTAGGATAEALRVGMECTYAPFNYKTADGELAGYDVDVANGVADLIGADIEFVCQEWDGMIPSLLANKFDLIIASMSITEKRMKKIDFSGPYRFSTGQILGAKSTEANLFDSDGKPIPENFDGLKVGLERATTYQSWFDDILPGADIVLYDGSEPLYLDLQNGRVDLIMTNPMKAHLKFLSKENGAGFEFKGPVVDEEKYFGIGVGIGLRQGEDELKGRLNGALKTLINSGELETYARKIFPFKLHKDEWGQ